MPELQYLDNISVPWISLLSESLFATFETVSKILNVAKMKILLQSSNITIPVK